MPEDLRRLANALKREAAGLAHTRTVADVARVGDERPAQEEVLQRD